MIKESYIIPIFVVVQVIIGNAQYAYKPYHMDHYVDFHQIDQGHVYHHYQPKTIVDPKNPQCKITCRPFFCEVTTHEATGSCFYPPYKTTCGGLPTGCGSCVEACGFKDNTKEISSVSTPSTISINTENFYPDFTVQHPEISSEWIQINGKYYHFCLQHTTFLGAKSICTRMGGKLFIPQSQLMNEKIDLIAKGKKFYFICEKI